MKGAHLLNPYVNRAHQAYTQYGIEMQTQGNLIVMLYDGAIRFITTAQAAIENKKYAEARENLMKAQRIIQEFIRTLNFSAGEISNQLLSLYEYMIHQLIQANVKKDVEILEEVKGHLIELRSAWVQIV